MLSSVYFGYLLAVLVYAIIGAVVAIILFCVAWLVLHLARKRFR